MTKRDRSLPRSGLVAIAIAIAALTAEASATTGCGDGGDGSTTSSTSGGGGGQGGSSTGGGGAVAGSGGQGATGGQGGSGGQGGAGGGVSCLDAAQHASVFSIDEPSLCLLAKYTAPFAMGYSIVPTWGRHGGPLTVVQSQSPADEVTLTRWQVPTSPTGTLTASTTVGPVPLSINQSPLFMNPTAIDLPFESWTLLSWSDFGSTAGEAIMLKQGAVDARYDVAGMFDAVGAVGGTTGRLLYTGMSQLGTPNGGAGAGLYLADVCPGPTLCATATVFLGGDASGVVTVDADGNVFATEVSIGGDTQSLRAFAASTVPPPATPAGGDVLFTTSGSGTALAALSPAGGAPGLVLLQRFNGQTFLSEDVLGQAYQLAGDTVQPDGTLSTAITMASPGTAVSLMSDETGRVWLAVDSGQNEVTFYVLGRPG